MICIKKPEIVDTISGILMHSANSELLIKQF